MTPNERLNAARRLDQEARLLLNRASNLLADLDGDGVQGPPGIVLRGFVASMGNAGFCMTRTAALHREILRRLKL